MNIASRIALCVAALAGASPVYASGGPFGIDHRVKLDNGGLWRRSIQTDLSVGLGVAVLGGALWEGGDSRLGKTLWQSVDSLALTAAATEVMKFSFSRERPSETADPNAFFKGHGHQSFPSGEVAEIAAGVTPLVLEYGQDHPWVYALELLPAYDMVARVKARGHWQSDVIAGMAIGSAIGWYAHKREQPLILSALPGGFMVGVHKRF